MLSSFVTRKNLRCYLKRIIPIYKLVSVSNMLNKLKNFNAAAVYLLLKLEMGQCLVGYPFSGIPPLQLKVLMYGRPVLKGSVHTFDMVFDENCGNDKIFCSLMKPLVDNALAGNHSMCFAYGETGSGKTHTMFHGTVTEGRKNDEPAPPVCKNGMFYQCGIEMINRLGGTNSVVKCRIFEIYMSKIHDLLNGRKVLIPLEGTDGVDTLKGIQEFTLSNEDDLSRVLQVAMNARKRGKTWANEGSSRSHLVIELHVCSSNSQRNKTKSKGKLCLVDLAGNERTADCHFDNKTTQLEMAEINTSLMYLNECIHRMALSTRLERKTGRKAKNSVHVSFRGTLLTRIHKESFLKSNTRMAMIATISPGQKHEHSIANTLLYARKLSAVDAKVITDKVQVGHYKQPIPNHPNKPSTANKPALTLERVAPKPAPLQGEYNKTLNKVQKSDALFDPLFNEIARVKKIVEATKSRSMKITAGAANCIFDNCINQIELLRKHVVTNVNK